MRAAGEDTERGPSGRVLGKQIAVGPDLVGAAVDGRDPVRLTANAPRAGVHRVDQAKSVRSDADKPQALVFA
jgi:hypothetical protein